MKTRVSAQLSCWESTTGTFFRVVPGCDDVVLSRALLLDAFSLVLAHDVVLGHDLVLHGLSKLWSVSWTMIWPDVISARGVIITLIVNVINFAIVFACSNSVQLRQYLWQKLSIRSQGKVSSSSFVAVQVEKELSSGDIIHYEVQPGATSWQNCQIVQNRE